jgi:hypothetical protein
MTELLDPVWAESGDTGEPPDDEKIEKGMVREEKMTWQRLNWLINRVENAANGAVANSNSASLMNIRDALQVDAVRLVRAVAYHPVHNEWYFNSSDDLYRLQNDTTIQQLGNHTSDASRDDVKAITPLYAVFGIGAGDLYYINAAGTIATDATPAMSAVHSIESKYASGGSDEFLMIGGANGAIEYSTTGPAGTWNTPTTAIGGSATVVSIVWAGGDVFYALTTEKLHKSIDNGDTWDAGVTISSPITVPQKIDYNPVSGRLVCGGGGVNVSYTTEIMYSDDGGANWTEASFFLTRHNTGSVTEEFSSMLHMGGGRWVATGGFGLGNGDEDTFVIISADDGETWQRPYCPVSVGDRFAQSVASDGFRIMTAAGETVPGYVTSSLSGI